MTGGAHVTKKRAKEVILSTPCNFDPREYMTPGEIAYVTAGWQMMSGRTCFMDALWNVAMGAYPFEDENEVPGERMSNLLKRWSEIR